MSTPPAKRLCPGPVGKQCGKFRSSLEVDPHPTCSSCRGRTCTSDNTCVICSAWTPGTWARYNLRRPYVPKEQRSGKVGPPVSSTMAVSGPDYGAAITELNSKVDRMAVMFTEFMARSPAPPDPWMPSPTASPQPAAGLALHEKAVTQTGLFLSTEGNEQIPLSLEQFKEVDHPFLLDPMFSPEKVTKSTTATTTVVALPVTEPTPLPQPESRARKRSRSRSRGRGSTAVAQATRPV